MHFFIQNLLISSIFLIEVKNVWQEKSTFIWQKVDIYFELVQSGTMVEKKKKGLVGTEGTGRRTTGPWTES